MIYYSNSQSCIIYLKNKNAAYLAIEGFVSSETIREFMVKAVQLCTHQTVKAILFDSSKINVLRTEDMNWIKQSVLPLFGTSSLKKVGYLEPQDIFGELSLEKLIPENSKVIFKKFKTLEDAEKWAYNEEYADKTYPSTQLMPKAS